MKTSDEIRAEAWRALWKGKWFWKILAVWAIFYVIGDIVGWFVSISEWALGAEEWTRYLQIRLVRGACALFPLEGWVRQLSHSELGRWALQTLGYVAVPELTPSVLWHYGWSTAYGLFFSTVVAGLTARGLSLMWLRSAGAPGERWFASALAGAKRPLGLAGLYFLQTAIVLFLSLFLWLPGYYASYCFQLAFFLKVDHPDWGAFRCLAESNRRMKGYKLRAFWLDWSYWEVVTWAMVPLLGVSLLLFPLFFAGWWWKVASFLLIILLSLVSCALFWFSNQYIGVGQAVLYREILADKE